MPELIRSALANAARGKSAGEQAGDDAVALPRGDVRKLETVLSELTECRRMLDAALEDKV